jgi:hypothetical protein
MEWLASCGVKVVDGLLIVGVICNGTVPSLKITLLQQIGCLKLLVRAAKRIKRFVLS